MTESILEEVANEGNKKEATTISAVTTTHINMNVTVKIQMHKHESSSLYSVLFLGYSGGSIVNFTCEWFCLCVCVCERECVFKAFMSEIRKEMEAKKI